MSEETGTPRPSAGKPYGRAAYTVRESYLSMLDINLGRQCADEQAGIIPGHFYDNVSQKRVRVQLIVYDAGGSE